MESSLIDRVTTWHGGSKMERNQTDGPHEVQFPVRSPWPAETARWGVVEFIV
jgi:hypothetical protein